MSTSTTRVVTGVAFGWLLLLLPALRAADEESATPKKKEPLPKAPDWSKYAFVADVVGEIVKADDKKIVMRVTWYTQQVQGGVHHRPNLSGNHRNFRNPYAHNMNRPNVKTTEHHHDYELEFVPESLVRMKTLPPKLDATGKRVEYTPKEMRQAELPIGVPHYAATVGDLMPGTIVDVIIVREATIPAAKAKEDDLRLKYVTILGKDPNPPKDIAAQKSDPKKKN